MKPNKRELKAFVRIDASDRVVPSSLILRKKMPKNGRWYEIPAYRCCTSSTTTCVLSVGGVPVSVSISATQVRGATVDFQHDAETACEMIFLIGRDPTWSFNMTTLYLYIVGGESVLYDPRTCTPFSGIVVMEGPVAGDYVVNDFVDGIFSHPIDCNPQ